MRKIFVILLILLIQPALADFENMCGVDGYSVFNAVYTPYLPAEYDNGPFDADDTFTCAANTPRVLNAVFELGTYTCAAGYYLPANSETCTICPENSYCVGGTYTFNETTAQGITACATGLYAPTGMWESAQCGRILHIGDEVLYLRTTKKTMHALHIDVDQDGIADYFGNMTTADVPMHAGTTRKLKVQFNGQVYSIYDDTVNVGE